MAKKAVSQLLVFPMLISHKIWMTEKTWNFHTVKKSWVFFTENLDWLTILCQCPIGWQCLHNPPYLWRSTRDTLMSIIDLKLLLRPTFHPPASPSASPPTRRPSPSCDHYKGACQDRRLPVGHASRVPLWRQHLKIRLLRFDNPFVEQRPKYWFRQPKKDNFSWNYKIRWKFINDRINFSFKKISSS